MFPAAVSRRHYTVALLRNPRVALVQGYNRQLSMTLQSGSKVGSYEIQSPLGAGGMGEVYLAWQSSAFYCFLLERGDSSTADRYRSLPFATLGEPAPAAYLLAKVAVFPISLDLSANWFSVGLNLWVKKVYAKCTLPRNKIIPADALIRILEIIVRLSGRSSESRSHKT